MQSMNASGDTDILLLLFLFLFLVRRPGLAPLHAERIMTNQRRRGKKLTSEPRYREQDFAEVGSI